MNTYFTHIGQVAVLLLLACRERFVHPVTDFLLPVFFLSSKCCLYFASPFAMMRKQSRWKRERRIWSRPGCVVVQLRFRRAYHIIVASSHMWRKCDDDRQKKKGTSCVGAFAVWHPASARIALAEAEAVSLGEGYFPGGRQERVWCLKKKKNTSCWPVYP